MTTEEIMKLKGNLNKLANGIDPQTGIFVDEYLPLSRFNKRILLDAEQVMDTILQIGIKQISEKRREKLPFFLSEEDRRKIDLSENPITISALTDRLNEVINTEYVKRITAKQITDWLMAEEYLEKYVDEDKKVYRIATEKGKSIGISTINRTSEAGQVYPVNVYNTSAQEFIIQHI